MRILLIGDVHLMDHPPASIVEGYNEEIFGIFDFCKTLDYDVAIQAGDLFDKKAPSKNSHWLVRSALAHMQELKDASLVLGNHDLMHLRLDSTPSQPVGVLFQAGIRDLRGWHPNAPVYGVPWQEWDDEDSWTQAFTEYREKADAYEHPLVVTHCPLFPPKDEEHCIFEYVPTKAIAQAMGNHGSVFYGHIHEYHGQFEVDGVTFCNLGAISRGALHEYNVLRTPMVAIYDTETGTFEEIEVPHRPADEHFLIEEHETTKASKKELEAFIESMGEHALDMNHVETVVEFIRTRSDVAKRVRETAIELLREVA